MNIVTSPKELLALGKWMEYCEITGTNSWAINEGLMDSDEPIYLTPKQYMRIFH